MGLFSRVEESMDFVSSLNLSNPCVPIAEEAPLTNDWFALFVTLVVETCFYAAPAPLMASTRMSLPRMTCSPFLTRSLSFSFMAIPSILIRD